MAENGGAQTTETRSLSLNLSKANNTQGQNLTADTASTAVTASTASLVLTHTPSLLNQTLTGADSAPTSQIPISSTLAIVTTTVYPVITSTYVSERLTASTRDVTHYLIGGSLTGSTSLTYTGSSRPIMHPRPDPLLTLSSMISQLKTALETARDVMNISIHLRELDKERLKILRRSNLITTTAEAAAAVSLSEPISHVTTSNVVSFIPMDLTVSASRSLPVLNLRAQVQSPQEASSLEEQLNSNRLNWNSTLLEQPNENNHHLEL